MLFRFLHRIFEFLPPPWVDATPSWWIAGDFPAEWHKILSLYHTPLDDKDVVDLPTSSSIPIPVVPRSLVLSFKCSSCDDEFAKEEGMLAHARAKDGIRPSLS